MLDHFSFSVLGLQKKEIKSKDSKATISGRVWFRGMARIGN
ncbi:hypothetical protein V6Z11_A10G222600 [Gossypium hirsutum]